MCALPYLYRRSCRSPCTCCGWLWQKESPSALGWKAPQTASGSGNKTDQLIIVFNLLIRCLADKEAQRGYSPPGCPVCSWCHRLKPGTSGRGTWPVGCSPSSWSAGALWPASRSSLASAGCRCLPSTCRGRHMHKINTWDITWTQQRSSLTILVKISILRKRNHTKNTVAATCYFHLTH